MMNLAPPPSITSSARASSVGGKHPYYFTRLDGYPVTRNGEVMRDDRMRAQDASMGSFVPAAIQENAATSKK
jgi:hypothetical protein